MKTKICFKCKKTLTLDQFKKHSKRKDGLQADCIKCQAEYRKKHYLKNKDKYIERAKNRNERNRKERLSKLNDLKKECSVCGEKHPACLEFHHTDPSKKDFTISQNLHSHSWNNLLKEIKKCIVVCSNCHKKIHYEDRVPSG